MCQNIHAPFLMALIDIMNRSETAVFCFRRVLGVFCGNKKSYKKYGASLLSLFSSTICFISFIVKFTGFISCFF